MKLDFFVKKFFVLDNSKFIDNELDVCLSKHSQQFWSNRTIEELRECWFQLTPTRST